MLAFLNWAAVAIGALMTLLYAVVCLMMLPYPEMVAQAGGSFADVLRITGALVVFTAVAGLATWLLQNRHPLWRIGQVALALTLAVLIVLALAQR